MISPTDQPERRSPYALFLEATDRPTDRTTGEGRRSNVANVDDAEAMRIFTLRSNRPIVAAVADTGQGPIIVVTKTRSGIPGGRRTDARTEEHAFAVRVICVGILAFRESGIVPGTITAAIWHTPTGRAWVVDCLG